MNRLLIIATGLALLAAPASAQHGNVRRGFWYGFGFGGGSGRLHCSICNDQSGTDLTASLRAGGTLSPSWLIGAEASGWTNKQDLGTRRSWSLSAITHWYPWPAGGAYAKAGLGLTGYRAYDASDALSTTQFGGLIGIGYEWRVGRNYSVNPYISYQRTLSGDLTFEHDDNNTVTTAVVADDASVSTLQFGVGLVIH